jgi:hypothetical protein
MATIIKIKTSSGLGTPATAKIGELSYSYAVGAYNTLGDKLFIGVGPVDGNGDASSQVVIGGKYFTAALDHQPGVLTASSAIITDANKAVDEIVIGNSTTVGGGIKFQEGTNNGTDSITIKAPNSIPNAGSYTLTLPTTTGTAGQFLKTDGSGNLAFETVFSNFTITGDTGSDTFNTNETLDFQGNSQVVTAVTNNQVAFSIANSSIGTTQLTDAGVTNAKLENSTITLGSSTLTLGGTTTDIAGLTSLVVDDITINGQSITTTASNKDITLTPHGTGTVVVPAGYENRAGFTAQSLVNKSYVDAIAEGLHVHASVKAATTDTLATLTGGTVTYDNGTSGVGATLTLQNALTTLDTTYSVQSGDRILVKDQANTAHNGIYTIDATLTILTRAVDFNTTTEIASGDFLFVTEGTLNGSNGYVQTEVTTSIGTSPILFEQFSGAGQIVAGAALSKTGNQLDVVVDNSSIEITGDSLNVKALGITNAMLAGSITRNKLANPFINISDESSTVGQVQLEQTLEFLAGEGINTIVSGNTVSIIGELATASNAGVAFFPTANFLVTSGSVAITTIDGGTY